MDRIQLDGVLSKDLNEGITLVFKAVRDDESTLSISYRGEDNGIVLLSYEREISKVVRSSTTIRIGRDDIGVGYWI